MSRRKAVVFALTLVAILSIALTAWAAVYRYGGGTTTLVYDPAGNYTCPGATQDVYARYQVDGLTWADSTGSVLMNGSFRTSATGTIHYLQKQSPVMDFDQNSYTWDTDRRYMTIIRADPSGIGSNAQMVMTVWCQESG